MAFEAGLEDRRRHTPKEGYDLVGMDDYEPIGEQLYFISHHKTAKEAIEAFKKRKEKNPNEYLVIYPTTDDIFKAIS